MDAPVPASRRGIGQGDRLEPRDAEHGCVAVLRDRHRMDIRRVSPRIYRHSQSVDCLRFGSRRHRRCDCQRSARDASVSGMTTWPGFICLALSLRACPHDTRVALL